MDTNNLIQLAIAVIMFFSVLLIYMTIKSNKTLNRNLLFNELVKQEIGLRIKLQEYREEIHLRKKNSENPENIMLDYDTLLFGYYEYLAICLYKKLVDERDIKLYFKIPLKEVNFLFERSLLFSEDYAKREDYPVTQWLFKRWSA